MSKVTDPRLQPDAYITNDKRLLQLLDLMSSDGSWTFEDVKTLERVRFSLQDLDRDHWRLVLRTPITLEELTKAGA
jgi:hypothetical protein